MNINGIYIDERKVFHEIKQRQQAPFNDMKTINAQQSHPELERMFVAMQGGEAPPFAYQGRLYRIHSGRSTFLDNIDMQQYELIGRVCDDDNSGFVLPYTKFNTGLVAFTKYPSFDEDVWYHIDQQRPARFLVANTGNLFGIDVNKFYALCGHSNFYYKEHEVLFPISQETLLHPYTCTPAQFKYYMRKHQKHAYIPKMASPQTKPCK